MNDAYTVVHAALRELYGHQNPEKWAVAHDAIESLGQLVAAARSEGYAQASDVQALEAEIQRLRTVIETIRDHTAIEAASSTNPVTASFLAYLSGKAREALDET